MSDPKMTLLADFRVCRISEISDIFGDGAPYLGRLTPYSGHLRMRACLPESSGLHEPEVASVPGAGESRCRADCPLLTLILGHKG